MNLAGLLMVVCAAFLQEQVFAQTATANGGTGTGTGGTATTTLTLPKRNISISHYRPRAQEFITNLDSISSASNAMRRTEPIVCDHMRAYLNTLLRLLYDQATRALKQISPILLTSQSTLVPEAINDIQTATTTYFTGLINLSKKYTTAINDGCSKLTSIDTLNTINQKIEQLRATQLNTAIKLAAIPDRYESEMQALYKPVEDIIGTTN